MTTRTSLSHPLAIASVSAGAGFGRIGITFCPGKVQPRAATGAWARDLGLDLDAVAAWGAAAVVTLVEGHELKVLGVEQLGAEVAARHMDWLHLAIADVSVPDPAFEAAWVEAGEGLRARLRAGFDILVHCKGGLGRAGLVTARLLAELGVAPADALRRVRVARPGAVETLAQERHVLGVTPVPERLPADDRASTNDRATGAMIGLAVGDAIGTTLEFSARDRRTRLTDMVGGGPFRLEPGQWTDDTAMALALADSLAADPTLDAVDLMDRFVAWQRDGTYSCTGRCFDIGVTTAQALARYRRSGDPLAGATDPMTAGNGSLMRLAPVALRHWRDPGLLARVAALQSRTTHGAGKPRPAIRSSGYVVHALEAALWCVGRTADFASAVLLAANLGDDADTTAAITGQLAGALYGRQAIPAAWVARLAWGDRLEAAARRLLA